MKRPIRNKTHIIMKKQSTILTLLCLLLVQGLSAQVVETITTSDFEQNGSQLVISFDIPYNTTTLSYNINSVFMVADDREVEVKTFSGDQTNLQSGEAYKIIWDVLEDVDQLYAPEQARILLEYTPESQTVADKIEEQRLREVQAKEERQEQMRRRQERRNNKPFTIGMLGYGGITHGVFEGTDSDLESQIGIGYGAGAQLEIRLSQGTYLQLEAAMMTRDMAYSHMGDDAEFNYSCQYYFDIERAKVRLTDYRGYAKVKFSSYLQVGGYVALTQTAMRSGEMEYEVFCNDGSYNLVQESNLDIDYLGGPDFPEDNDGATPFSKIDYGLTVGIESPTKSSLILGLGYDISLANLINPEYDGFNNAELVDIYPSQEADLKLGFAYLRIGVRF
jgi:hypothetical protein